MNSKISTALVRLSEILPIRKNQRSLNNELLQIHHEILNAYASTDAPEATHDIALLKQLQQLDLVVLDNSNNIIGAYPFTSEKRAHSVELNGIYVHCMCALDALAISPMFKRDTTIYSECMLTSTQVVIRQQGLKILNPEECTELYFAIDWSGASETVCCANSLCTQMSFISGKQTSHDWASDSGQRELFTLNEAIVFAADFFVPLISQKQAA